MCMLIVYAASRELYGGVPGGHFNNMCKVTTINCSAVQLMLCMSSVTLLMHVGSVLGDLSFQGRQPVKMCDR